MNFLVNIYAIIANIAKTKYKGSNNMLVEKEQILKAKSKLGEKNADIIAEVLNLEKYDAVNKKALCPWHLEDTPSFIYNPKTFGFHCFRGDTGVITKQGVFRIDSLLDKEIEVINGNGEWEKTRFHFCGEQQIYKLELTSRCKGKTLYTTGEHDWIVRSKTKKVPTKNLKKGYRLSSTWVPMQDGLKPSVEGMQHGFIYGDGYLNRRNVKQRQNVYYARICTEDKLCFCKSVFSQIFPPPKSELESIPGCSLGCVKVKAATDLKKVPQLNSSLEYLYGFLIGLFVADGNRSDETAIFSSSKLKDLTAIRNICTIVGIPTYSISSQTRDESSNMGLIHLDHKQTMYTLRMVKSAVTQDFYFGNKRMISPNTYSSHLGYKVVSVEKTSETSPVYCCETSTQSFVLEDFILTGNCFGCSKNTDIIDAYMHTGLTYLEALQKLFELAKMPISFGEKGVQTKYQYKYPHEEPLNGKELVYKYLKQRGISEETVDRCDVRQDKNGNIVFNYYDTNDVLCLVKYRPSHKIDKSKGEIKSWCQKGADTTPLLFNMNRVNVNQPLVVTEGEGDALAAIEAGYTNTVSVPFGANNYSWIEENFDWLEQFDSIIICSDNDEAGIKMQKECVFRLGSWRTKFIDIPPSYRDEKTGKEYAMKDLNHVLYYAGKQAVLDLIHNAKDSPVDSVADFSDITNIDLDEIDGVETGIPELDKKLMKLFYGTFTIVTGVNGSGKSSFLSQLVCNAIDSDKNAFLYSGELPNFQSKNWINYILAGQRNVKEYHSNGATFWKVTPEAQRQMNDYYKGRLFIYKDGFDHKVDSLLKSMEDTTRKYGCKLHIIDNLTSVNLEANEQNKFQKQEEFVTRLIDFAKKYNVAVLLVVHPHKIEQMRRLNKMDIQGISAIIDLAHRILSLYRVTNEDKRGVPSKKGKGWYKEPIPYDVLCDVLKDRLLGFEGSTAGLYYDRPSRRFFTDEKSLDKRYGWDTGKYTDALPFPPPQLNKEAEDEVYGQITKAGEAQ